MSTTKTQSTSPQIEKFEKKKEAVKKFQIIKIYNEIDLTKAIEIAKKKPLKSRKPKKGISSDVMIQDFNVMDVFTDTNVGEGSIRDFINDCHPSLKSFISHNVPKKITASCGKLTIVTKNDIRLVVQTISHNEKHIKMIDSKKTIIFNGITHYDVKKVERKK